MRDILGKRVGCVDRSGVRSGVRAGRWSDEYSHSSLKGGALIDVFEGLSSNWYTPVKGGGRPR